MEPTKQIYQYQYKVTNHLSDWLKKTKNIAPVKYSDEQCIADIKKWIAETGYKYKNCNLIKHSVIKK